MSDIKEKNLNAETKENIKRKFDSKPQPTDISTTVRLPLDLREEIANYCKQNRISMNTFLLLASKEFLKISS